VNSSVAALIVSHDGARWLPAVIDGLGEQRTPVDAVVAVDTTSRDESSELLRQAFGCIVEAPGSTSFPDAVTLGLEHVGDCEWVWLLHDDSRPAPEALEALLAAAEANPDADILGPKLREWPSLRRLLELGVTISGTGRRETGLERGEFDQGQHDDIRTVLAVNTAGMLVRRSVLEELGGFDPQLPIFGNDIDFGWRAAAAGHRTIVVPQAVVFHAEAAHRGVRRTPITGRHTHYQERRAALYTLLVNAPAKWLPFQVLRLGLGTLIRMVGFLLVRQVGQSLDELAALVSLYSAPDGTAPDDGPPSRTTYGTSSRRDGCPTGTASTSSATWPPQQPCRPRTSPSVDGRPSWPRRGPRSVGPTPRRTRTRSARTPASWCGS
jgi:GT2 family glycosyltransferase